MGEFYKLLPSSYSDNIFRCLNEIKHTTKDKSMLDLKSENRAKWKERLLAILTENHEYFINVSLYTADTLVPNTMNFELTNYIIYKYPCGTDIYGSEVDIETMDLIAFYELVKEIMEEKHAAYIVSKTPISISSNMSLHLLTISVVNNIVLKQSATDQTEPTLIETIHNVLRSIGFFYRRTN